MVPPWTRHVFGVSLLKPARNDREGEERSRWRCGDGGRIPRARPNPIWLQMRAHSSTNLLISPLMHFEQALTSPALKKAEQAARERLDLGPTAFGKFAANIYAVLALLNYVWNI